MASWGGPPRKGGGRRGRSYDEFMISDPPSTTARGRNSRGRGRGRERGGSEFYRDERGRGGSGHVRRGHADHGTRDARAYRSNDDHITPQSSSGPRRIWNVDFLKHLARVTGDQAVNVIFDEQKPFFDLLSDQRTFEKVFKTRLVIQIIYNITNSSNPQSEQLNILLSQICSSKYAGFHFNLAIAIRNMPSEKSQKERDENFKALNWLVHIFTQLLTICPQQSAGGLLPIADLLATAKLLQEQSPRYRELVDSVTQLVEFHKTCVSEKKSESTSTDGDAVLEDYRELPILPDLSEISKNAKPKLQENLIEGSYSSWSHYLDVQFRLLREDFISPLRQGICDYSHGNRIRSIQNIRVYQHVHVNEPICLYSGVGFRLKFDITRLQHISWEHSRRLIFGSLLCLSSDEFLTVYFASVVKRDPKLLKEGYITIKFEGDTNGFEIDPQTEFTMVESTAYFEAYRHILCRLQTVEESPPPFKAYIVECKPPKPLPPPSYLKGKLNVCFDLSAMGVRDPVQLLDPRNWPHHDKVTLDKSQLQAVHMALTQELSLIQGPPGTGKTYIGLKIVQALLQNKSIWDSRAVSPILVVCYTNHALDQFLEGILKFGRKELKIVRIGGRSKSKEMEPYMLRHIVDQCHAAKSFPGREYRMWRDARITMKEEQRNICKVMQDFSNMNMETKPKLLTFRTLERVMDPDHANQLRMVLNGYVVSEEGKEIEFWLGIWFFMSKDEEMEDAFDEMTLETPELMVTEQVVPPEADATGTDADPDDDGLAAVDAEAVLLENDRIIDEERIELEPIRPNILPASKPSKAVKAGIHHDEFGWQIAQLSDKQRWQKISQGMKTKPMKEEKAQKIENISQLKEKQRWSLYQYWVSQHLHVCKQEVANHVDEYTHACGQFQEAQSELDSSVLCSAHVVGMTTTGAAKYHQVLHKMKPKIIVIEEAAEVLESHIVTTLAASTQQVIMIGDHQQLRPKPNDYVLATKYNLEVSLFERLVTNKLPLATLEVQHRMRPEIAELICPHIYETLKNDPKVEEYEKVNGVKHDVFFIDHAVPEDESLESDILSHSNKHEAEFVVQLCHYFIKLGYRRSQITILTMYSGQLLKMKKMMPKEIFEGVRVSAVDDFQGEENDIIILSLVRSNDDGRIGFLKEPNRVCVALSRAKKGLFVIGNFSMLKCQEEKFKWPGIIDDMEKKGLVDKALPLYCAEHKKETLVSAGSDFSQVPEGGCLKVCGTRLSCGHACPRLCHPGVKDHLTYKCRKMCGKMLTCGHRCKGFCYQCCDGCRPCTEKIIKKLRCGHNGNVECYMSVDGISCSQPCVETLPCGHACTEKCGAPCTPVCKVAVITDLPCGHKGKVYCYKTLSAITCRKQCKEMLSCGHQCAGTCSECHLGRLHASCKFRCGRTLPCGHNCDFPCTNECPPCSKPCGNYCSHSRCIKTCGEPCVPCMEDCQWKCKHLECSKKCGEMCDRPRCDRPCRKKKKSCGHPCIGLCGEKCPSFCRVCNAAEVSEIFFGTEDEEDARFIQLEDCDHILEVSGLDQWMDQQDDATDSKAVEIQFKSCPKCKTSVRRSLRYGNIIKQTLHDMEEVKKKILGMGNDRRQLWKESEVELQTIVSDLKSKGFYRIVAESVDKISEKLKPDNPHGSKKRLQCQLSLHQLNAVQYQLANLPKFVKLLESMQTLGFTSKFQFGHIVVDLTEVKCQVADLCNFMVQDYTFEQIQMDIECEFRRLSTLIQVCDLRKALAAKTCRSTDITIIDNIAFKLYYAGWRSKKIASYDASNYNIQLTDIGKRYGVGCITEQERVEIVKAIGLSKGHWFKCPNGHFYCIGECGGAMQMAKCPECNVDIGGMRHTLTAGNVHAPEMDNSSHAAWSDAANMGNYDFDELGRRFM
ncbi:NFX1-type zinc finger-containing protein 1-like [Dysidea avara]|uniref:NFX1-type zinc finger-containing protein 1-like n=1 Tax=Dysidea avara TaxID=196820 RepID=UPI0033187357